MKIISEETLAEFRAATRCEWCGRELRTGLDPHHWYFKRGMGGGGRMDHRYNLVSLCRGFGPNGWVSCHQDAEAGRITKDDLLAVVAAREGVMQADIEAELWRLRRARK